MPFPHWLARANRYATNRVMIRLARRPPFVALRHTGRSSGLEYRIPLNVFPAAGDYLFALTYGSGADWVKNVMNSGGATLEYSGADVHLIQPRLVGRADAWPHLPLPARAMLRGLRVQEFLVMSPSEARSAS